MVIYRLYIEASIMFVFIALMIGCVKTKTNACFFPLAS